MKYRGKAGRHIVAISNPSIWEDQSGRLSQVWSQWGLHNPISKSPILQSLKKGTEAKGKYLGSHYKPIIGHAMASSHTQVWLQAVILAGKHTEALRTQNPVTAFLHHRTLLTILLPSCAFCHPHTQSTPFPTPYTQSRAFCPWIPWLPSTCVTFQMCSPHSVLSVALSTYYPWARNASASEQASRALTWQMIGAGRRLWSALGLLAIWGSSPGLKDIWFGGLAVHCTLPLNYGHASPAKDLCFHSVSSQTKSEDTVA